MQKKGPIQFSGNERIKIEELFHSIKNSFTYELWVKPESQIEIQFESQYGVSGITGQRYAISPGYGGDPSKAGIGISVGTNGIVVYEHTINHMPATLVYPFNFTDWTHIAIVYENRTPTLYINGVYIKKGKTSLKNTIIPSGIFGGHTPYGEYVGQMKEVRLWDHARTAVQIKENYKDSLIGNENGLFGYWTFDDELIIKDFSKNAQHGFLSWKEYHLAVIHGKNQYQLTTLNIPTIDVIIPVYNSLVYLKKCLESVFRNTDIPYNLILINDCSTDENVFLYLESLRKMANVKNLKDLSIIHNEKNQGYTKNVNNGISMSNNHVVLLNSDTIVPKKWLSRLITPIYLDNTIASVTPFSNNATICSFPIPDQDNPLPENMTIEQMNDVFMRYGSNRPIIIPVGVGFCLALNRKAIEDIGLFDADTFGTGYCEENDWCQRANKIGYVNILIPNLFVYHKMGASFTSLIGSRRDEQIQRNYQLFLKKHPGYITQIEKFYYEDPAKQIRDMIIRNIGKKG